MSGRRQWRSIFGWGWTAAPRRLLITAALMSGGSIASVIYPIGLAIVIDAALHRRSGPLVIGVLVLAVLFTATWTLAMLAGSSAARLSDETTFFLSARIAEQLNAIDSIDHLERPAYRAELDILQENVRLLGNGARQMLVVGQIALRTAVLVVILAFVDVPLVMLPLAGLAPFLGERISVSIRQRTEERLAPARRLADALFELATSAAAGKELRVFGAVSPLRERHRRLSAQVNAEIRRSAVRGGLCGLLGWLVFAAAFIAGIAAVVIRAVHGRASVGEVVLAVTLIQRAQLQVGQAAASIGTLLTTARQARRMLWLEHYARESAPATPPPRRVPATLTRGIELRGVSFGYPPDGPAVLSDIDLRLPAGSAVALVGENGAGKTTLVKLLTGMYRPTEGTILLDDVPLTDVDLADWRARAAAAFQDFVRFEFSAREVVGVGDLARLEDERAVGAALERADATAVLTALKAGLDTPLGRSFTDGQDLSGGQWQRLALARAMMRPAPLLLVLDEPTASLDALTEAALFERYLAARSAARRTGAITVLISHRFSTVRMADEIVVLEHGRIRERGSHAELMRCDGLYAELFKLQAQAYR